VARARPCEPPGTRPRRASARRATPPTVRTRALPPTTLPCSQSPVTCGRRARQRRRGARAAGTGRRAAGRPPRPADASNTGQKQRAILVRSSVRTQRTAARRAPRRRARCAVRAWKCVSLKAKHVVSNCGGSACVAALRAAPAANARARTHTTHREHAAAAAAAAAAAGSYADPSARQAGRAGQSTPAGCAAAGRARGGRGGGIEEPPVADELPPAEREVVRRTLHARRARERAGRARAGRHREALAALAAQRASARGGRRGHLQVITLERPAVVVPGRQRVPAAARTGEGGGACALMTAVGGIMAACAPTRRRRGGGRKHRMACRPPTEQAPKRIETFRLISSEKHTGCRAG
jgi:hypothetical protein